MLDFLPTFQTEEYKNGTTFAALVVFLGRFLLQGLYGPISLTMLFTLRFLYIVSLMVKTSFGFIHEIKHEKLTIKISDGNDEESEEGDTAGWRIFDHNVTLLSTLQEQLTVECNSAFPIKWNITGFLLPIDILVVGPYKRTFHSMDSFTFTIKADIYFSNDSSSSMTIGCQRTEVYEDQIALDVFVPNIDGSLLFSDTTKLTSLKDSSLIPCAVTDPRQSVTLMQDGERVEISKHNITYHPRYGFMSPEPFPEGNYTCIASNDVKHFRISKTEIPLGYTIHPKQKEVSAFFTDEIDVHCVSSNASAPGYLEVQTPLLVRGNGEYRKIYVLEEALSKGTLVRGSVKCITSQNIVVWDWNITFVDKPSLFLDNFAGEVNCLLHADYDDYDISMGASTINCNFEDDCSFLKQCFSNPTCNDNGQKQYSSSQQEFCSGPGGALGTLCSRVNLAHSKGIIECSVNGLTKHFLFHNSIGRQKYEYKPGEHLRNLLRMDEVNKVLYTNITATFICEGVSFIYADSIIYEMVFKNGTTELMTDTANPGEENELRVFGENTLGILSVNLSVDAVGIRCIAPLMYSKGFETIEKSFVTKHLLKPTMQNENQNVTVSQTSKRLNCSAISEPPPRYQWFKLNMTLLIESSDEYLITTGIYGESLLEFLEVNENILGEYICEASNNVLVEQQFKEDINNDSSRRSVAYQKFVVTEILQDTGSSRISFTLYVFLCIMGILSLVAVGSAYKYYTNTKMLIRQLTEEEIQEFYEGNASLAANISSTDQCQEMLTHLPYNKAFEIDISKIELETGLLGQGNFSVVFKGHWKPSGDSVAVKMSKSTADVVMFKSLLTEVKIMIHIGKHKNILTLLGASTSKIRERQLYMVFELCEFGSLESYLRDNKSSFRNHFQQNQDFSRFTQHQDFNYQNCGSFFTTKNLLQWSGQICCGMEYLSFKNVIHADLATRNVLLASELTAKVSDFGLSKQLYDSANYTKNSKAPLPWRWMALESLQSLTFSTKSDIWSFGVTAWEIFTLGNVPFPNEKWDQMFVERVSLGMRIGKPKFANNKMQVQYSKIAECCNESPDLRPSFCELRKFFEGLHESCYAVEGLEIKN